MYVIENAIDLKTKHYFEKVGLVSEHFILLLVFLAVTENVLNKYVRE